MSMKTLLWSRPVLCFSASSTFCMLCCVMLPYNPSIPSPPPSLFCRGGNFGHLNTARACEGSKQERSSAYLVRLHQAV